MNKVFVLVLIGVLFNACSIKDVSKAITKYDIQVYMVNKKASLHVEKILKIEKIKSPKYINSEKIWYKNSSFQVDSYIYSSWSENFSDLIENSIANTIFSSGLFKSSYVRHSKVRPDLLLEGQIINAMQYVGEKNSVEFAIRFYLIEQSSKKLISSKDFIYNKKVETIDAKGAVMAYNEIVKNLNKDVVLWLSKSVTEN